MLYFSLVQLRNAKIVCYISFSSSGTDSALDCNKQSPQLCLFMNVSQHSKKPIEKYKFFKEVWQDSAILKVWLKVAQNIMRLLGLGILKTQFFKEPAFASFWATFREN